MKQLLVLRACTFLFDDIEWKRWDPPLWLVEEIITQEEVSSSTSNSDFLPPEYGTELYYICVCV